jgi:hypothetical protein
MYKNTELLLPEYAQIKQSSLITKSPIQLYKRYIGDFANPYNIETF